MLNGKKARRPNKEFNCIDLDSKYFFYEWISDRWHAKTILLAKI